MAGSSVTKTAELRVFSRASISMTMTEFEKHGKISSNLSNSRWTTKLTDRDRRALKTHCGKKASEYCRKSHY